MSWQAASFTVLAIVLVGGFAWYERSRPPSQIVALVAAMAALAVAGRVAFPVIPNVVATTDIVLFTGYAIGAAPGFAVGALAGLVSNFWLGQGPWTPWQMAGWGMCGLAGAWLAALSGRRLGRFGLAAACGIAGLAFGALLDFSLMVTYGGEQSLDRFLAFSARGVPFNIAHAAGNVAIALAAGPALVRMLVRFRERFEFRWKPQPAVASVANAPVPLLLVAALLAGGLSAGNGDARAAAPAGAPTSALTWMRSAQNADGGFGVAQGSESNPGMTGWAALGIEAAGVNPLDMRKGRNSPIDYMRSNAAQIRSTGDLERTILVLRGAGLGTRHFGVGGGSDLVSKLRRQRDPDGSFEGQVNLTAFGVFALAAVGASGGNGRSAAWLASVQNPDGGWGFAPRTASDADSTGAAVQAAALAGEKESARNGADYLRRTQASGGGFALSGGLVNSQSTAWAIQGLVAAGSGGQAVRSGLRYLAARRAADGHYRYSATSDQTPVWVTGQALMAVTRQPFPVDPAQRSSSARSGAGGGGTPEARTPPSRRQGAAGKAGETASDGAPTATPAAPVATPTQAAATTAGQEDEPSDDPGTNDRLFVLAGIAAAAAITWGGWLLYRRRLP